MRFLVVEVWLLGAEAVALEWLEPRLDAVAGEATAGGAAGAPAEAEADVDAGAEDGKDGEADAEAAIPESAEAEVELAADRFAWEVIFSVRWRSS